MQNKLTKAEVAMLKLAYRVNVEYELVKQASAFGLTVEDIAKYLGLPSVGHATS